MKKEQLKKYLDNIDNSLSKLNFSYIIKSAGQFDDIEKREYDGAFFVLLKKGNRKYDIMDIISEKICDLNDDEGRSLGRYFLGIAGVYEDVYEGKKNCYTIIRERKKRKTLLISIIDKL
jgi:hypothetical protein